MDQAEEAVELGLRTVNPLYTYAPNTGVYHCPGDTRSKKASLADGWAYDSYSKTQNVGGHDVDNYWKAGATYTKLTNIKNPSSTFIFMEDADDRNSNRGTWVVRMEGSRGATVPWEFQWIDPPAMYHGDIGTTSFADGHSEAHKWMNPRVIAAGRRAADGLTPDFGSASASATRPDSDYIHDNYRYPGWK